jgi:hypothetical protein
MREGRIPGYHAERMLEAVRRFRANWMHYHRPEDVNQLLRLFPTVHLPRGFILDYLPVGGVETGWIFPFARREAVTSGESTMPAELAAMERDRLATKRGSGELRRMEVEHLYRHLTYDPTPTGLFEYGFFISELWATKSASRARDWLDLEPIFTRRQFDAVVRAARQVTRVIRPEICDPLARLASGGGGQVEFIVYQGAAWKRIFQIRLTIEADGGVRRDPGELLANLG